MQALSWRSFISRRSERGQRVVLVEDDAFLESIGGIGAMLRYRNT
jgi:peptide subunit release factor 1 (eRF1)